MVACIQIAVFRPTIHTPLYVCLCVNPIFFHDDVENLMKATHHCTLLASMAA